MVLPAEFEVNATCTIRPRAGRAVLASAAMRMTPIEWLDAYRKAWAERDADAAAALFTEDATYAEQPFHDAFAGRTGIHAYWTRVTAGQTGVEMRYGAPITVGDRTAVEWWTTLTNQGEPITLAGAFVLTFDPSGLCRALREYWNLVEGAKAPPDGWGS